MEVKMNKDIREYKSKNSLNLTLVQTFVGVIGVIASGFTILHFGVPSDLAHPFRHSSERQ